MKMRTSGKMLLASTVVTAAALAGSAFAAGQTPFASHSSNKSTMQLAEMSCGGAASCGGNMDKHKKSDNDKDSSKS